jgi:hypothetical protein
MWGSHAEAAPSVTSTEWRQGIESEINEKHHVSSVAVVQKNDASSGVSLHQSPVTRPSHITDTLACGRQGSSGHGILFGR